MTISLPSLILLISLALNIIIVLKNMSMLVALFKNKAIYVLRSIKKIITFDKTFNDKLVNEPFLYYACHTETRFLSAINQTKISEHLPDDLIIKPGNYYISGKEYDFTQEGLYRFVVPDQYNHQRIVFNNNIASLLSAIAWIISHGEIDDTKSIDDLVSKATASKLYLTCEAASRFTHEVLNRLNIKSRVIGTRTLDRWNTYDDGHYLIEVYHDDTKQWVLYDIDNDLYFSINNRPLSLYDFVNNEDQYEIVSISNDCKTVAPNMINNYDYTFVNEERLSNLRRWYKRIMQLVYIENNDGHYTFNDQIHDVHYYPRGAFPNLTHLNRNYFANMFYKEQYE